MLHLIRWACFFITLLLSLILIVSFLYELQGSLWLRSIKVIGQHALFMSFGWADSTGSSSLRRQGDQMLVAPTISSQSITELGGIENSREGSYIRMKHTQICTEDRKKAICVCVSCLLGFFLAVSVCIGYVWLWNIFGVQLKMGHIKQMPPNCGVVTGVLWWAKWNQLCQSSLTEAELCGTQLWQHT